MSPISDACNKIASSRYSSSKPRPRKAPPNAPMRLITIVRHSISILLGFACILTWRLVALVEFDLDEDDGIRWVELWYAEIHTRFST